MAKTFVVVILSKDQDGTYKRLSNLIKKFELGNDCHIISGVLAIQTEIGPQDLYAKLSGGLRPGEEILLAPLGEKWLTNAKKTALPDCYQW